MIESSASNMSDRLIYEASCGALDQVVAIIQSYPKIVGEKNAKGRTALHAAAYNGHLPVLDYLLNEAPVRFDIDVRDNDGDTALHFACFGNQHMAIRELLKAKANINATNGNECSPLHVAVNKLHVECVRALVDNAHRCDLNIQDKHGDTPLHDIVRKRPFTAAANRHIMQHLLSKPGIDLLRVNQRGFNVFHQACLKENLEAMQMLLAHAPSLLYSTKSDGFTSLHIAALNGLAHIIDYLLTWPAPQPHYVDLPTANEKQTALMLAVSQYQVAAVEALVAHGANPNLTDEDGDSCLHLIFNKKLSQQHQHQQQKENSNEHIRHLMRSKPAFAKIVEQIPRKEWCVPLTLAAYLIDHDADLQMRNRAERTCLDYIDYISDGDARYWLIVRFFERQDARSNQAATHGKCKLCDEEPCSVVFGPCGHRVVCAECSVRMRKCIECNAAIVDKSASSKTTSTSTSTNIELSASSTHTATAAVAADLLTRIRELEEAQTCSICMERKKETAFQCGHVVCQPCSLALTICHICRQAITKRIKIFVQT